MHKNASFLLKNCKIAHGLRPKPPYRWHRVALPSDLKPPAAGSFTPRAPTVCGGWEIRLQTPTKTQLRIPGYATGVSYQLSYQCEH